MIAIALGAFVLLAAGFAIGLLRGGDDDASATDVADARNWAGVALPVAQEKPAIVLEDTSGKSFDLRQQTKGKLTVLFFGYTSCPDICPLSLETIDKTLEKAPADVRAATRVVFVSVDPKRDTPEVIRSFLDAYDREFIGLTGTPAQLREAQTLANVPPSELEDPDDAGFYIVGHSSEMIAYSPDGVARVTYPFGTRQSDWARDLPRLVAGEHPDVQLPSHEAAGGETADANGGDR
jgi:protein SCO1/2